MKTKDYKKEFRNFVHNFVKERINEVKDPYSNLGFKDVDDMLSSIKKNDSDAMWAFMELMTWGLGKDYCKDFQCGVLDEVFKTPVFNIKDFYFVCDYDSWCIKECGCHTEVVTIKRFKVKEE